MPSRCLSLIEKLYVKTFGRPSLQKVNDKLLHFALRSRGYLNFADAWESGEANFIRLLVRFNPGLCIDVGANKGNYSRALLGLPETKVIAFEPLPKAFKSLEAIRKEFPDRFRCFNLGIADRDTVLTLHFGEEDSELASYSAEVNHIGFIGRKNVNVVESRVITLDSFLENRTTEEIDLLKIDTEGYENEVLAGARNTICYNPPKFIQIEFNYHQLFRSQSLYSLSKRLPGYKTYQLLPFGHGLAPRDPSAPETNIYYYSNFVFVREDIARKL
jgi:FkbM family methyltransferase